MTAFGFGSILAGGLPRFRAIARALAFVLIAALTLPSIAAADHTHPASDALMMQTAMPDGPFDAMPDCCPLCHVSCACHAALPVVHDVVSFDRHSLLVPSVIVDAPRPSARDNRLKRPPRA